MEFVKEEGKKKRKEKYGERENLAFLFSREVKEKEERASGECVIGEVTNSNKASNNKKLQPMQFQPVYRLVPVLKSQYRYSTQYQYSRRGFSKTDSSDTTTTYPVSILHHQ